MAISKEELAKMLEEAKNDLERINQRLGKECHYSDVERRKCSCPSCQVLIETGRMVVQDIMMINEGVLG